MSTDKPAVLAEMFRVLVPGGRIGIADVVAEDHLSVADREAAGSYVGCLAGALSGAEYLDGLSAAGFADASATFTTEAAFNPVVTAADWVLGRRTPRRYGLGQAPLSSPARSPGPSLGPRWLMPCSPSPSSARRTITAAARSARSWPSPSTRSGPARFASMSPPGSRAKPERHPYG